MAVTYISESAAIQDMVRRAVICDYTEDQVMDAYYMSRPLNPTMAEVERACRETMEDLGID